MQKRKGRTQIFLYFKFVKKQYDTYVDYHTAFIGFTEHNPISCGLEYFEKVLQFGKEHNIKICFENVEGEEYLEALMNAFSDYENVGFCWDSGHELCYNKGKDRQY